MFRLSATAALAIALLAVMAVLARPAAAAGDLVVVANTGAADAGEVTTPKHRPAVSNDGRFVAYVGQGDINEYGDPLYLRDMSQPAPVAVVKPAGGPERGFDSAAPVLSADGRYLAFASEYPGLSSEDVDFEGSPGWCRCAQQDVFVWDRLGNRFTLVSRRSGDQGVAANDNSSRPSISFDGRFVAYGTASSNLSSLRGEIVVGGVYRRDLVTEENARIAGAPGIQFPVPWSGDPDISGDGRRFAYAFQYARRPYDPQFSDPDFFRWMRERKKQIMVHDRRWSHPRLVSRASGRQGTIANDDCREASVSGSGRFVAFTTAATNLVPGDRNGVEDVFVRDLREGRTILVSRAGEGGRLGDGDSGRPSISGDGRYVAFQSKASNLVAGDSDEDPDLYVKDLETGRLTLVTRGIGEDSNGRSGVPAISPNGRWLAFASTSSNLSLEDQSNDLSFYRYQLLP